MTDEVYIIYTFGSQSHIQSFSDFCLAKSARRSNGRLVSTCKGEGIGRKRTKECARYYAIGVGYFELTTRVAVIAKSKEARVVQSFLDDLTKLRNEIDLLGDQKMQVDIEKPFHCD